MKNFKVGMAKVDITPKLGTLLYGYPLIRPADKVLDNLYVNAVAINQDGETVVLISAELCEVSTEDNKTIASEIAKITNIKKENILCSAIHTHSGPLTRTVAGWGEANTEYINNILIPCAIEAANKAIQNMQDAVVGIGTAESFAGINRRELTPDGEVILGQNPDGPYDPTMTAICFRTIEGENIGSIIHFACHPTAAGQFFSITRDWPGYMIDRVEKITGAPCMHINGAIGDVGPRLSNGKTTGDDSYAKEVGLIAADDAEKAVNSIKEYKVPKLKVLTGKLLLPLAEMPSLESVIEKMEAMGDPEKLIEVDITTYDRLKKIKGMLERNEEIPKTMELSQTVISIDDLALVPFPLELFCKIALTINEKSPFDKNIVMCLTGGSVGYLPTEDQLPFGGYEIDSFRAATIPGFVDGTDKNIVSECLKLLNKLYTI